MHDDAYIGMGYHIMVADMEKMVAYYRDVIGLELVEQGDVWSGFRIGDAQLGLHAGRETPVGEPVETHFWLQVAQDRLEEQLQRLTARGAKIVDNLDGMTVVQDPEGNRFTVA